VLSGAPESGINRTAITDIVYKNRQPQKRRVPKHSPSY
jgi:hypothetical protein